MGKEDDLWDEGGFIESISPAEIESKKRTIKMCHSEEMNAKCRKCNATISAHNRDWHDGMCDRCFNATHYSNDKEELVGLEHNDFEKILGFTHYLETKDIETFKRIDVDHNKLVDAFIEFNNGQEVSIVWFNDGIIKGFPEVPKFEHELRLLNDNEGRFSQPEEEELADSYGFFTDEYMAEFMQGIIFFSGKEEPVVNFSELLTQKGIKHHPPDTIGYVKREGNRPKSNRVAEADSGIVQTKEDVGFELLKKMG
ncbi:MAG: hypothetical protein ABIC95_03810 [archaeon]